MSQSTLSTRLRAAREKAGFKSASEAARKIGVNPVTYTAHENGGREYDRKAALYYAERFSVRPDWLMFGTNEDGTEVAYEIELKPYYSAKSQRPDSPMVREYDVRAGAENGSSLKFDDERSVKARWGIPEEFLKERLGLDPEHVWIIEMLGDSMYDPSNPGICGSLRPGDKLFINTADRRPTPPGSFAVWDGTGVAIRMVEAVYRSEPAKLRMTCRNPNYSPYEALAEETTIIGRVVGRLATL